MSHLKTGVLTLLISFIVACGYQVVEFPLDNVTEDDGGSEAAGEAGLEAGMDALSETGIDAGVDATIDAAPDTGIDVGVDTGIDARLDTGADARMEASVDTGIEASVDAGAEASIDAGTEASIDAGTEASIDAGTEASIDAGTEASVDAGTAPTVLSTTPMNGALNVSINERPTATFSEPMDPTTITRLTFILMQGLTSISGAVSYDALTNTATFSPTNALLVNLPYTAQITTGARATQGLGGAPLAATYTWNFMTAACSQAIINLRSSGNFAVLAGSTVTNTGPTSVTGDLGVSPGTAVTGFPPGILIGNQHAGDPTSAQGIADLTTAYNDAAGRTLCPVSEAGDLGGLTLGPGLYKSTSSLAISGNLTLDAMGDGNAVFVFQMATTLAANIGSQIILAGGAKASNVFWQVGTSATLFSSASFQGTIMADQAITLNTGATLTGRALARIAAVTMDSNTIVTPGP